MAAGCVTTLLPRHPGRGRGGRDILFWTPLQRLSVAIVESLRWGKPDMAGGKLVLKASWLSVLCRPGFLSLQSVSWWTLLWGGSQEWKFTGSGDATRGSGLVYLISVFPDIQHPPTHTHNWSSGSLRESSHCGVSVFIPKNPFSSTLKESD